MPSRTKVGLSTVSGLKVKDMVNDAIEGTKTHVCHLTTGHKATDTRIFGREARSLAAAGYHVSIVGRHGRCEVIDGIRIIPMRAHWGRLARFSIGLLRILRLALQLDADLYHFHDPELIVIGLVLSSLGKRVIYDVHEDYEQSILTRKWLGRRMRAWVARSFTYFERHAAHRFDHVIVVDSNIRQRFAGAETTLVTNAPPSRFAKAHEGPLDNKALRIVSLGSISVGRGIRKLVDALLLVHHKDVRLHLVGDAHDSGLQALWSLSDRVIHHGRIPWEEAQSLLGGADVGVLLYQPNPIHLHFTGEGNTKLFEYMAAGLPVLYSHFPKLRQLLEPIECGIPVDPTDPQEIAAAIDHLYENPALRKEMGQRGRQAVLDRYNWEHEEQKLLAVYERVLGAH
jgi:glycosyltransferase involved in cell wall biosynthesis